MTDTILRPDTYVNFCWGGAYIIDANDARSCGDCEWFGVWADAPEWLKEAIRAEYEDELVEVTDE